MVMILVHQVQNEFKEDKGKGPAKGTCKLKVVVAEVSTLCLPIPCPLSNNFSPKVISACENGQLSGNMKFAFLREAATFYHGLCPKPTQAEYGEMAKALCDKYPSLKKTKEQLWKISPMDKKLN